ncbi:MAG: hypothetical protein HQ532_01060 [Candidatus Omnitrophica bacterium]|nr:hypothetical protein [Candidatus Omnitrophota bacterium]
MAQRKNPHNINKVFMLMELINKDKRYGPESYSFVLAALGFTRKSLKRKGHISGQELLEGIREYALEQFGPMARTVLERWGITTTGDFGEIVFNMLDAGLLGKSEKDSKEDFSNIFDFKAAFDKSYKYTIH